MNSGDVAERNEGRTLGWYALLPLAVAALWAIRTNLVANGMLKTKPPVKGERRSVSRVEVGGGKLAEALN